MVPGLPRTETSTYSSMYQFDISVRWIPPIGRPPAVRGGREHAGSLRRPRAGNPWVAGRDADARVRAAQAAQPAAGLLPRTVLRLAVPVPEGPRRASPHRRRGRVADAAAACPVGQAGPDRLRAHCRRQGAPGGDAGDVRPLRLGGRPLRGAIRLVLPDRRRDPTADPGGCLLYTSP